MLVPIANEWMQMLRLEKSFPESFEKLQAECHSNNQFKTYAVTIKIWNRWV